MTLGHLDIITRARKLADEVVIAIGINPAKRSLLDDATRLDLITRAVADMPGVRVELMPGLLADFCREVGASSIIKGLRGGGDYDAELPMALMNRHLCGVDTVFITADPKLAHIASSMVREIAKFGGDVSDFVPPGVASALAAAFKENND